MSDPATSKLSTIISDLINYRKIELKKMSGIYARDQQQIAQLKKMNEEAEKKIHELKEELGYFKKWHRRHTHIIKMYKTYFKHTRLLATNKKNSN